MAANQLKRWSRGSCDTIAQTPPSYPDLEAIRDLVEKPFVHFKIKYMDNTTSNKGKWYFVSYFLESFNFYDNSEERFAEPVFILEGGSIARHIGKYAKENSHYDQCGLRGMPEGTSVTVTELSLLLPNGQKISGFKPKSIAHLFSNKDVALDDIE